MFLKKAKIKKLFFPIIVITVLFLAPTHFAKATSWIDMSLSWIVGNFLQIIFQGISQLNIILVHLLEYVIKIPVCNGSACNAVVYKSWQIMRDFANMFFIIALIIMAFATIFDIAKYSIKSLIAKFLIAALLINFSLTLGVLVIDGSQIINNTFLTGMGNSAERLGNAINPADLLPDENTTISSSGHTGLYATIGLILLGPAGFTVGGVIGSLTENGGDDMRTYMRPILGLVLSIVLSGILLVSVLGAALFSIVRIPVIWFLLVISPIAWIASVFPPMQEYYKQWWKQYIGWNLFLPIFLFFFYFGLYFMTNLENITDAINVSYNQGQIGPVGLFFQNIFGYIMAGIFLIGGIMMSFKISFLSGTGAVKAAGWAKGSAMKTMGFTSMGRAAQMKYDQVKKEGLPGRFGQKLYGGEAGQERRTAVWAERFGVKGAGDQQLAKDISANKKRFENITDAGQLRGLMNKGSKSEQLAIREIMKGRNLLSGQELMETHNLYGGNKSLAGKQFARSIDFDKLSKIERETWLDKTGDIETKQKVATVMADKGELRDIAAIKKAASLFTLEGQQTDLINKTKKGNLILANQALLEMGLIKDEKDQAKPNNETNINEALAKDIFKMTPDMLLEYTKTLTKKDKDPEKDKENEKIRKLVAKSLTAQKIKIIREKATKEQLDAWDDLINTKTTETNKESPKSQPNIILTPGAQFEADNPERGNVVDLRNPK